MKKLFKRIAGAILSAVIICGGITSQAAGTTNLVSGIVPVQNFESTATGSLSTLTDGIAGDYSGWYLRGDWHSSKNPTITFDLGAAKKIGKVVVIGSTKYGSVSSCALAENYDISYSADNSNWTVVKSVRNNAEQYSVSEFTNVEAQYWSIRVYLENSSSYYTRIVEIEMYEGEDLEAPEVAMTVDRIEIDEGEALSLSAIASCNTSEAASVEFFNGDTKLADGVLGEDGIWSAEVLGLAAGEYIVTAAASAQSGAEAKSSPIRVRVHSSGYANIALHKASFYTNQSGDANDDVLVDGLTDKNTKPYVWATDSRYNSTRPLGAEATIDLASGFDNEFWIKGVTVHSAYGNDGSEPLSDFSIYYYYGDEWTLAASVTGANGYYAYTFPSEVLATQIKIISDQASTFRVREIEVTGTLSRKTLSKTKTEITDDSGNALVLFTPGTYVYASSSVSNYSEADANITAILAIKEKDGALLAVGIDNKNAAAGNNTEYNLSVKIPDNAVNAYCEIYWWDMNTLTPYFASESCTSLEKSPYSSDELVVDVDGSGFKVYVKGSNEYANLYTQYNFSHINSTSINADLYRIYNSYAVKRTGDTAFAPAMDNARLLSDGELEFAFMELVNDEKMSDFVGGFHGDERLTDAVLKIDGEEVDLSVAAAYKCASVEFVQNSVINRCDTADYKLANHKKSYAVTKDGVTLNQEIEWLEDVNLIDYYYCMFPVDSDVTDYVRYFYNGNEIVFDAGNNPGYQSVPIIGVNEATVYGDKSGYYANVKFIPESICTVYPTEFFFQVREAAHDTKVYIGNYNDNTQVAKGTFWKWQNIYQLDLAETIPNFA